MSKLSKAAARLNCRSGSTNLPALLLLTDEERLPEPEKIIDRLQQGSGIILRHYDNPKRRQLAFKLSIACRQRGLKLFIAGDLELALACNAHGLHLPAWKVRQSRRDISVWKSRPNRVVTAAAHSSVELRHAQLASVDAALISPVFPTISHPQARPLGLLKLASLCRFGELPVYALGGITQDRANQLINSGVFGLAGISGF